MEEVKPAIEVKNITKSFKIPLDKSHNIKQKLLGKSNKGYREFTPLKDISFTVNEGDFFGIVGRNGSGKSTLLKTIAGIYTPQSGKVSVNGSLIPFIELGVGFNPQLTGRENVYLNGALLGFSRSEIDDMYEEIVDFAELHDFMEERLQNYSSGMQVRLAFSISIRARGDILLLDEVLAVGDAAFQKKCYDYFAQLKRDKKTVILVTHSMVNVERFCNRALLLNEGEIAYIGSSDEVAERYHELFNNPAQTLAGSKKTQNAVVKKVDIQSIQNGKNTTEIKAYKDFSIKLSLTANIDIIDPNISITITDRRGNLLLSQDTKSKKADIDAIKAGDSIELEYAIENIYTNGEYSVGMVIMAENSKRERVRVYDMQDLYFYSIFGVTNNIHSITHPKVDITLS